MPGITGVERSVRPLVEGVGFGKPGGDGGGDVYVLCKKARLPGTAGPT